jgi:tetratricopeptide (TPR) repeat protein
MKVLISPVGKQDPHGKPDEKTGDTEGSAIAICRVVAPNRVILLPTSNDAGSNTVEQAQETKEWIETELPGIAVEIHPVAMNAANDYEEALRAYGDVLTELAEQYVGSELFLNASSGTPAIKFACLLSIAEGRIAARAYYADDPTVSQRPEQERVYLLNVTFLRESALMQQCQGLLAQGQFQLAQEPLDELCQSAFAETRQRWAGFWKRLAETLRLWDERRYSEANGRLGKLLREWTDAPARLVETMRQQQTSLSGLTTVQNGAIAWDIYFQSERLQNQGHITAALEHLWIAMESMTFERLERMHSENADHYELKTAIHYLLNKDSDFQTLWQDQIQGRAIEQHYHSLREKRNDATHRGKAATPGQVEWMKELTQRWLSALGCAMPSDYPMSPQALERLASIFICPTQ